MYADPVDIDLGRRLAACWNACEGFTTEQLENILILGDTLRARFEAHNAEDAALSAERDTLRQHLQACVTGWQKGDDVAGPMHAAMALLAQHQATTDRVRQDIAHGSRQSNGKLPG
jgi:hypothetical protein